MPKYFTERNRSSTALRLVDFVFVEKTSHCTVVKSDSLNLHLFLANAVCSVSVVSVRAVCVWEWVLFHLLLQNMSSCSPGIKDLVYNKPWHETHVYIFYCVFKGEDLFTVWARTTTRGNQFCIKMLILLSY